MRIITVLACFLAVAATAYDPAVHDNREFVDDPSQLENEDREREFFKKLEEASQKEVMSPLSPDNLPVEDSKIDQAKEEEENVNEADDSDTDFEPFVDDDEDNEGDYISPDEGEPGVIVDGDIILSKTQAAIYKKSGWDGLVEAEAWRRGRKWKRTIRFRIHRNLNGILRSNLFASIHEIQRHTCVRFQRIHRRKWRSHMLFKRHRRGCFVRHLGRSFSGARRVFLNERCAGFGRTMTPAHEIMHAMGRHHEQNRPDRDRFVRINSNTCRRQFRRARRAVTYGIPYDYYSLMHYSPWQCARSLSQPSMSFPSGVVVSRVGQRVRLSLRDMQHINQRHCPSMMMRLVGGKGKNEGRIEVLNNNVWGSVCSNGFDTKDGNVICKYLGHPGLEEIYTGDKGMIKTDGAIWMNNLQCKGNEESPFDCVQSTLGEHDCNHNQDVAIKCSKAARLVGGNDNSGRLEVYHEGQWGSVCSHKFGYHEATVACRMMGYSSALQVLTNKQSGKTNNKIVLSELTCAGTESHLTDCQYDDDEEETCSQGHPVHIECRDEDDEVLIEED